MSIKYVNGRVFIHVSTGATRNSSADEIANVNFLRRHRTRITKYKKRKQKQTVKQSLNNHNKVYFTYGKHTMSTAAK